MDDMREKTYEIEELHIIDRDHEINISEVLSDTLQSFKRYASMISDINIQYESILRSIIVGFIKHYVFEHDINYFHENPIAAWLHMIFKHMYSEEISHEMFVSQTISLKRIDDDKVVLRIYLLHEEENKNT